MADKAIPDSNNILYTVTEVATLLKTNPGYVYKIIKLGLLPVLKLGRYKVRKESLLDFLKKYEGKDLTEPENICDIDAGNIVVRIEGTAKE